MCRKKKSKRFDIGLFQKNKKQQLNGYCNHDIEKVAITNNIKYQKINT